MAGINRQEHIRRIGRHGRNGWCKVCYYCGKPATHVHWTPDGGSTTEERSHWDIRGCCDDCAQKQIDRGVKVKGGTYLWTEPPEYQTRKDGRTYVRGNKE